MEWDCITNILTLSGLRDLWERRKQGLELPDGWLDDAKAYLEHKRWACDNLGGPIEMKKQRKLDLEEAEALLRCICSTKGGIYVRNGC